VEPISLSINRSISFEDRPLALRIEVNDFALSEAILKLSDPQAKRSLNLIDRRGEYEGSPERQGSCS
jgi:hypothetical protein